MDFGSFGTFGAAYYRVMIVQNYSAILYMYLK